MKALRLAVLIGLFWLKVPVVLALLYLSQGIRHVGIGLARLYG